MKFRRHVVQVARIREQGVSLEKFGANFAIHPITLSTYLEKARSEDGVKLGMTSADFVELRKANKLLRLPEHATAG